MVNICPFPTYLLSGTCSTLISYITEASISVPWLYSLFDQWHFLYSPFAYVDPLHCNMAYLYLELLKDSLNEYAYAAELAGLNYDLQNTVYGMYVSIHSPITFLCYIPDFTHPTFVIPRLAKAGLGWHGNFKH